MDSLIGKYGVEKEKCFLRSSVIVIELITARYSDFADFIMV